MSITAGLPQALRLSGTDAAYLAGVFDSRGYILLDSRNFSLPNITLWIDTKSRSDVLGAIFGPPGRQNGVTPAWRYKTADRPTVEGLLTTLLTVCSADRVAEVYAALDYCTSYTPGQRKASFDRMVTARKESYGG